MSEAGFPGLEAIGATVDHSRERFTVCNVSVLPTQLAGGEGVKPLEKRAVERADSQLHLGEGPT